jgi:nucleotide-binding universal stress UspA family protein
MMKKILCPVDFSESSDYAVWYAHELSTKLGGELHCLHVVNPVSAGGLVDGVYASSGSIDSALEQIADHAEEELGKTVKRFEMLGVPVVGHHRVGRPADEIVAVADELDADVIVIATHGRTGFDRLVFGSTCEKVVRQSSIPVLSVKHPEHWDFPVESHEDLHIRRVLCPVDFSEFTDTGVEDAALLCRALNATLVLGHVVDIRMEYPLLETGLAVTKSEDNMQESEKRLEQLAAHVEGVNVVCRVRKGQPHRALIEMIEEEEISIAVLPTHGYQGVSHMLLGSVAERMVRLAPCPVLTMRPIHISPVEPAGQHLERTPQQP